MASASKKNTKKSIIKTKKLAKSKATTIKSKATTIKSKPINKIHKTIKGLTDIKKQLIKAAIMAPIAAAIGAGIAGSTFGVHHHLTRDSRLARNEAWIEAEIARRRHEQLEWDRASTEALLASLEQEIAQTNGQTENWAAIRLRNTLRAKLAKRNFMNHFNEAVGDITRQRREKIAKRKGDIASAKKIGRFILQQEYKAPRGILYQRDIRNLQREHGMFPGQ